MAILEHLQVSIGNASTRHTYAEFDDRESDERSSPRTIRQCIEVEHGQYFEKVLGVGQRFGWKTANGLAVVLDFDDGARVKYGSRKPSTQPR